MTTLATSKFFKQGQVIKKNDSWNVGQIDLLRCLIGASGPSGTCARQSCILLKKISSNQIIGTDAVLLPNRHMSSK